jgi:signal transduction histidine kinase
VYKTGQTAYIPDRHNPPPEFSPLPPARSDIRSQITVPLRQSTVEGDRPHFYGTLSMAHPVEKHFAPHDVELLKEVGDQLALTLHRISISQRQEEMHIMAALGQDTSSVLHQIKNDLISARKWYDELMRETRLTETTDEIVRLSVTELDQRLTDVFTQTSHWQQRFEKLTKGAQKKSVNLHNLLKDVIKKYRQYDNLQFSIDITPDIKTVYVDEDEIQLALKILLDNAVQAIDRTTDERTGKIQLKARYIDHSPDGTRVELHIKDNGAGMTDDVRGKILKLLYRELFKLQTRSLTTSWGYGLWAASYYIRRNAGVLRLSETTPDTGTTFTVKLPCYSTDQTTGESADRYS